MTGGCRGVEVVGPTPRPTGEVFGAVSRPPYGLVSLGVTYRVDDGLYHASAIAAWRGRGSYMVVKAVDMEEGHRSIAPSQLTDEEARALAASLASAAECLSQRLEEPLASNVEKRYQPLRLVVGDVNLAPEGRLGPEEAAQALIALWLHWQARRLRSCRGRGCAPLSLLEALSNLLAGVEQRMRIHRLILLAPNDHLPLAAEVVEYKPGTLALPGYRGRAPARVPVARDPPAPPGLVRRITAALLGG